MSEPTPDEQRPGGPPHKPTPARRMAGGEAPALAVEPNLEEVVLQAEGGTWRARVLGSSGGAAGRSPPLLLLGFWQGETFDGAHSLEAMVVGRTLAELSCEKLEQALTRACSPPAPDRKRSFFAEAGQGRKR